MDILGDYAGVVGVGEVQWEQVDFWIGSDDFLMRQAVLDISYVDGSGSPVSMKFSVSFHGYGGLVVIDALEIASPEIAAPEIASDEGYPSLIG